MLASELIHMKCLAHFLVHSQNSTLTVFDPSGGLGGGPSHSALPLHTGASWNCPGHPLGTSGGPAHVAFPWQNLALMAHRAFALGWPGCSIWCVPGPSICHPCCHRDSKDTWIKSPWRQGLPPTQPWGMGIGKCAQKDTSRATRTGGPESKAWLGFNL